MPTGQAALDALLGGGLPAGRLTAVRGPPGGGALRLVAAVLAPLTAGDHGRMAAWVDGPLGVAAIHPPGLHAAGVDLRRLLIVQPADPCKAVRAAVELLAHGAFPVVVLRGVRPSDAEARRMLLAAEAGLCAGVVVDDEARPGRPLRACAARLEVRRAGEGRLHLRVATTRAEGEVLLMM